LLLLAAAALPAQLPALAPGLPCCATLLVPALLVGALAVSACVRVLTELKLLLPAAGPVGYLQAVWRLQESGAESGGWNRRELRPDTNTQIEYPGLEQLPGALAELPFHVPVLR